MAYVTNLAIYTEMALHIQMQLRRQHIEAKCLIFRHKMVEWYI